MTTTNIQRDRKKVKDDRFTASKPEAHDQGTPQANPPDPMPEFLQQDLLVLLTYYPEQAKIIRSVTALDLYEGSYRGVAAAIYDHLDRYKRPPKDHVMELFGDVLLSKNETTQRNAEGLRTILYEIHHNEKKVDVDYTMERLAEFIQHQNVKKATLDAADIIFERSRGLKEATKKAEALFIRMLAQNRELARYGSTPEPVDIIGAPEITGWPELTVECLPKPLFRYVMAEAERLNADPCPLAAHVLAACAASISDAWHVRSKEHDPWTQQPRIWPCVVKDVGARGTDMLRSAFWPVQERDKLLLEDWKREHRLWEAQQDGSPEPKLRRLTTQNTTIEAATQILAEGDEYAKLVLQYDELVSFFGGFNRYSPSGAAIRAEWLESYDGGLRRIDRIKRGNIYVPNWSIIVAGNIQSRKLTSIAKDLIDDGLFQRFMTIHSPPNQRG